MNELGHLPAEDALRALLESYVVTGSDIESRTMKRVVAMDDHAALRADVTALRTEVAALRGDIAEIKRILLAPSGTTATFRRMAEIDPTRGNQLLPYAPRETTPNFLG